MNRGPRVISRDLFSAGTHKKIEDIRYFMTFNQNTTGSIPEFWTWTYLNNNRITKAFVGISKTAITNYNSGATSKYSAAFGDT